MSTFAESKGKPNKKPGDAGDKLSTLKIEAIYYSETPGPYRTTWRYNP
jgi:hypothetical protein